MASGHEKRTLPVRRTDELRIGRVSLPGATYFVTLCEAKRRAGLAAPAVAAAVRATLDELRDTGDFALIAATVMPDHVHLLGTLGSRLSLPRAVGRLKSHTREALRACGLAWQENFHEHRLRAEDDLEPFARYVFLNPYRAGLISLREAWPGWWRGGEVRFEFEAMLEAEPGVPPEWLGWPTPEGAGAD
jgi:REP element-mobilizing transposase RayT